MRALSKIAVTSLVAAAALGVGIGSALADPSVQPARTDIVGVGSDTLTPVFTQFSTDYNKTISTTAPHLYSWNAVGTTPIQTKGTKAADPNCNITRPNGSSAGISALEANPKTGGTPANPCIDFARSSRARKSTDPTTIAFDALAQDAITWAATDPAKGGHVPAGASLLLSSSTSTVLNTLQKIYTCQSNGSSYTWQQIFGGTASTAAIKPVLPQVSSGTRSQFLTDIGVTTPGACVINATGSSAIEENEGTNPIFWVNGVVNGTPDPDVIFPYSVGAYIAQEDTLKDTTQSPGALLPQDLTNPTTNTKVFPISGDGSTAVIANGLPTLSYRTLYAVTQNAGTATAPAIPAYLSAIFGKSGWICTNATAKADITAYGFRNLGANCGNVS
jgi:ABC-type phosphate transport system substrate-binding protein